MKNFTRENLITRILSNNTGESFIANRLHSVLQGCDSKFRLTQVSDFLNDKKLFDAAKDEIYDILTDEHQKSFDIAERILWGNKKQRKMENFEKLFAEIKTNDIYKKIKKIGDGENNDFKSLLLLEFTLSMINLPEYLSGNQNEPEGEKFLKCSELEKSKRIIQGLKHMIKIHGLPLLPEHIDWGNDNIQYSNLDANMNTISAIMGIAISHEWTKLFTEPSMEFMMRSDSDDFGLFLYHFEIDTPEKINNVMTSFNKQVEKCRRNGAYNEGQENAFVEFIHDSFGGPEGFSWYLTYFNIKTIENLEKLFPYGIVQGKMHKLNQIGFDKLEEVFTTFGIDSVDKYVDFLESYKGDLDNIIFKEIDKATLEDFFQLLLLNNKEERLNYLKEMDFSPVLLSYTKYDIFKNSKLKFEDYISRKEYVKEVFDIIKISDDHHRGLYDRIIETITNDAEINDDNRIDFILGYSDIHREDYIWVSDFVKDKIKSTFQSPESKDLVYDKIHNIFSNILTDKESEISHKEIVTVQTLEKIGVGNMGYTSLLVNITKELYDMKNSTTIDAETKNSIINNMNILEEKIKNRSRIDKSDLYGSISTIVNSSAILGKLFLDIVCSLSNKECKIFIKDALPIIVSRIILLKKNINEERYEKPIYGYDKKNLDTIEGYLQKINNSDIINAEQIKKETLLHMQAQIKEKFGLKELPIHKIETDLTTIQNYLTYLSNIYHKENDNNKMLGLFFGLQINDLRHDFRSGKEIDFTPIFSEDLLRQLNRYLEERKEHDIFKDYSLETRSKVQEDTISQNIGKVTTIDTELSSLIIDIQGLLDPDNFPNKQDILYLVIKYGKDLGSTLALLFQNKPLGEKLKNIKSELEELFGTLDKENVEKIQTILKEVSPIVNFVNTIESMKLKEKLETLESIKKPKSEIIDIFKSIGETLSTDSGVIPINNDINYLKNLLIKEKNQITENEKQKAMEYLIKVEEQVLSLYKDKQTISTLFDNMKRGISSENIILNNRIEEIAKHINYGNNETGISITTRLTNNMDIVIPNIRGCLGCMQKEINNDHNLAFGDSNKFFSATYGENPDKTIADCIVDIFPYKVIDTEESNQLTQSIEGEFKKAFVIERVYGEKTPDILLNIITTILKKQQESGLQDIDILVSDQALESCYTKTHHIQELSKSASFSIEEYKGLVRIPKSPSGYGYYEFGGETSGNIEGTVKTSGILLRITK